MVKAGVFLLLRLYAPMHDSELWTTLLVGFGIGTAAQAREVAGVADGVVVGSAIVKRIERHGREATGPVAEFVRELADAVHGARKT